MSSGQADLGLCLYEQAYEWGRNHNCPGASLVALSRLTELAFVELAYKLYHEMTRLALQKNDVETLTSLHFVLSEITMFRNLVNDTAPALIKEIEENHPEIIEIRKDWESQQSSVDAALTS